MRAVRAFMDKYQTPEEVLAAQIEDIAETIHIAGMPIKKATAISKATKYVLEVLNGNWDQFWFRFIYRTFKILWVRNSFCHKLNLNN